MQFGRAGACVVALGLIVVGGPAGAADIFVTAGAVDTDPNGNCSLVEAIEAAEYNVSEDKCPAGETAEDVIHLPRGSRYVFTAYDASTLTALLTIKGVVRIEGNGSIIERSSAPGTAAFRLFNVDSAGSLTLVNVTLANGYIVDPPSGSGLADGGAIYSAGSLMILDSKLVGNTASSTNSALGGAVGVFGGSLVIANSLIVGNQALTSGTNASAMGGGLAIGGNPSPAAVINTTIAFNTAATEGGGVVTAGNNPTFIHDTITGNSSPGTPAAGLDSIIGNPSVHNTVIAGNSGGPDCSADTTGATAIFVGDGSCSPTLSGDPKLGALGNHGGPTPTEVPAAGSPLIDAADTTYCTNTLPSGAASVDQRGVTRPVDGNGDGVAACDIGAVEYVPATADMGGSQGGGAMALATLSTLALTMFARRRRPVAIR